MSNVLYNIAREQFGSGVRSWTGQIMQFQLLKNTYVFDAAHVSMDDVPVATRILAPQTLGSKSMTDGYAVSSAVQYTNATSPDQATQCVIFYQDPSLIDANHRLVAFMNQVAGFPLTLEGGDYFITGSGPNAAWFRI